MAGIGKYLQVDMAGLGSIGLKEICACISHRIKGCTHCATKALDGLFFREGRRGEHLNWASLTKAVISQLIYKIFIHMIHKKIAYFQAFKLL